MKVVLLCGGLGTRMREETEFRPKPMVEIGNRPVLWHIMKIYAHYGHKDFVCCLGYKGHVIKDFFVNYETICNDLTVHMRDRNIIEFHEHHQAGYDFNVTLAHTGHLTMTGGRVKRVQKYVPDETFMVTYGDGVSDVNIAELVAFHKSHGKLATMTTVQPRSRWGIAELIEGSQVACFTEKPREQAWASIGYFVFNRGVFDYLSEDSDCVLENEPLRRLVEDGQLMAYRHPGWHYAMDTQREYQELVKLWETGKAPWKVW
jgi:glucose-1-phosphate cytidylyltransferase